MDFRCPACLAPGLEYDGAANLECAYCGTALVTRRVDCPACGERNDRAAEMCSNCGEPLSIVASILDRQGSPGLPLWMRRLRSQVGALKESEEQASLARFAAFQEIDQRRVGMEAAAHAQQQARDSNIIFYGLVGILLVVLLALAIAIVQ